MNKKSYTHFSFEERETLSLGVSQGYSLRTLATVLGRPPSTVSREHRRNGARNGSYRACTAQYLATVRRLQAGMRARSTRADLEYDAHCQAAG
jgi:IS30 family transposase